MKMTFLVPLVFLVLASSSLAAPSEDLITDLPGLSWKPNFKQYSGYLQGKGTKRLHYWFVESSSNPHTDPVVLWMNGGPGCSSLDGFLSEHGPLAIQPDGKTVAPNPFAWNQVANMIYLEAPAGVGFSYSEDKDYKTNDDEVALNNHLALQDFFKKFPELKDNDFYITGESYGGIYVPTLTSVVLDDSSIKLKGFAVGNGLSSSATNDNSIVYFAYYHGLIGEVLWTRILKTCCASVHTSRCDFVAGAQKSQECSNELAAIQTLVWGSGLNVYNLYSECVGGVGDLTLRYDQEKGKFVTSNFGWPFMFLDTKLSQLKENLKKMPAEKLLSSPPCINDTSSTLYLNTPSVRAALHIPEQIQKWQICSTAVELGYERLYDTMAPQYHKAMERKMRILVYNGDVDMACNFLGDEWFVDSLNVTNPQERKKWFYQAADGTKQIAGFVKAFERFNLVTVRGAGHMVPSDKPRPALEMFVNFIQDKPF